MLSAIIPWLLLFIHRHFDSVPKRHGLLFSHFPLNIEISNLTKEGGLNASKGYA